MILVFIFLGFFLIVSFLFFIFVLSSIKIKIENLRIENSKNDNKYKIFLQIYLLGKIKLFSLKLNNDKIKKMQINKNIQNFNKQNIKIDKEILKAVVKLLPKLEKLYLKMNIGTEDVVITSYIIGMIGSIISIILPYVAINMKDINYKIMPIYNENKINIYLDSIMSLKIVHIIYVIYILVKKGSKKNERTSNRRSYAVRL